MRLAAVITLTAVALSAGAQRRITPIDNPSTATQHINRSVHADSLDRSQLAEMTDAQGRTILVDTVTGTEVVDSAALRVVPKMQQPLIYAAAVGVNVWDPLMRLFGQRYGLIEFGAEFNMHNRYIPVFEFGLGEADNTPKDNNYTYKSKLSPYFRIGMNYNFIYNSNPSYMAMAGVRYGFSPFSFHIADVSVDSPYWRETAPMEVPGQNVTVGYIEVLFNLRVRIAGPVFVGWAIKFHQIVHESAAPYGKPWYIPGYGTRNMPLTGAVSITYQFEFGSKKNKRPPVDSPGTPLDTPHFHPQEPLPDTQQDATQTFETEQEETSDQSDTIENEPQQNEEDNDWTL